MQINLIFARSENGVIGNKGALPWHLPEDMARFKRLTSGWPVIMGRKTWESLPVKFRPLPGRRNIVVTRQPGWAAAGASAASSFEQAMALSEPSAECWVIGGAQIYAQAMPFAQRLEITELAGTFSGDAFAPPIGPEWSPSSREDHVSSNGMNFSFLTYLKHKGS